MKKPRLRIRRGFDFSLSRLRDELRANRKALESRRH
jgi:hypothetical protein